ncbi:MAG: ABC transporter ATP-binding protein [Proteobacteria bacterium]|nr:ABC transporter ATP-binding protein [Pseudomonadota bacterium]
MLSLTELSVALAGRAAVSGVSLTVTRGEVIALLGANGAGKTTLMRAGLGLIVPRSGMVRLGGGDPHLLNPRDRALRAAYLPQRPQSIWPISVEHLVALGRYAYGAAPERLSGADQAAVDTAIQACSLEKLRSRRMDEISGGEKARAHLARAIAQHAPLLMLDEPTAGLDPAQALAVADIIRTHAPGGAVVFSTHDVALAARTADRLLLLREGRVVAEGAPSVALTPETLEATYGRSARIDRIGDALTVTFS